MTSQSLTALGVANRRRTQRAEFLHDVALADEAQGLLLVRDALTSRHAALVTMPVVPLLAAPFRWGEQRAERLLENADVPAYRALADLSPAETERLALALVSAAARVTGTGRAAA